MDDQTKQMFWTAAFLAAFNLRDKHPGQITVLEFADKALEAFEERFGKNQDEIRCKCGGLFKSPSGLPPKYNLEHCPYCDPEFFDLEQTKKEEESQHE